MSGERILTIIRDAEVFETSSLTFLIFYDGGFSDRTLWACLVPDWYLATVNKQSESTLESDGNIVPVQNSIVVFPGPGLLQFSFYTFSFTTSSEASLNNVRHHVRAYTRSHPDITFLCPPPGH